MLTQLLLVSLLGMQTGAPGLAWDVSAFHHDAIPPEVFSPSVKQVRECPRSASVCFLPGGSATVKTTEVKPGAPPLTVLARNKQTPTEDTAYGIVPKQPWQVEMIANLGSRATAAPIEVDVQDADTPPSMENLFARVVWDVDVKPGNHLGMRVALPPDQGFDSSHSYRVRILQQQGKAKRLLAEGELHLG